MKKEKEQFIQLQNVIGTDKNLGEVVKWFKKYELSNFFRRLPITLHDFLNGSDIVVYE